VVSGQAAFLYLFAYYLGFSVFGGQGRARLEPERMAGRNRLALTLG
jgi:hypothetical protein